MSKKQNSISLSTIEAEYIVAGSYCTQFLWMQKILLDNTSVINISKNHVQHSRTKHIEIQHHFIWELVEDGTLILKFIHTDDQKVDLFTKPLDSKRFEFLHQNIGEISMEWSLLFLLISHAFASSFMFCVFLYVFVWLFFSLRDLVLGTHSTKIESSLLDSCDQCTIFLCMRWMICYTCEIN